MTASYDGGFSRAELIISLLLEKMEQFGLLAFVLILFLGVVSRQYVARLTPIPYTVVMMLCGGLVGGMLSWFSFESPSLRAWYNVSPMVLLYTFIPILVFESAFMTDTHIFLRMKWQILTLAAPGVLLASVLTGSFIFVAFERYDWNFPVCLMVGAILSATDPVAVVALLKEVGVSERLGTLIEGESLLNDGTAIVIFDVTFHALKHAPCRPELPTPREILVFLVRLGLLGPVVGTLVGWACATMLGYVLNDPFNEIAITILACFASFGVAEGVVETSGVLSVVVCGMYLSRFGRGRISAAVEHAVHSFWSVLAHVANTAIFFLSGLIMANRHANSNDAKCYECAGGGETTKAETEADCASTSIVDVWYLLELYVVLHLVRGLVLFLAKARPRARRLRIHASTVRRRRVRRPPRRHRSHSRPHHRPDLRD